MAEHIDPYRLREFLDTSPESHPVPAVPEESYAVLERTANSTVRVLYIPDLANRQNVQAEEYFIPLQDIHETQGHERLTLRKAASGGLEYMLVHNIQRINDHSYSADISERNWQMHVVFEISASAGHRLVMRTRPSQEPVERTHGYVQQLIRWLLQRR